MNFNKWILVVVVIAYLVGSTSILLLAPAFWNATVGETGLTILFLFTLWAMQDKPHSSDG